MQTLDWDAYLKPPNISAAEQKTISAATFASHRETIAKLCRTLRPHAVLCMGAGYLNDIPLETLVANNSDIYLAEWIDGITEPSFQHDLTKQVEQRFVCLVCQCLHDPKKYCQNHEKDTRRPSLFARAPKQADHCDNFVRANTGTGSLCGNYAAAAFPRFLHADITRGVAENFARQVAAILRHAKNPRHALRQAIDISARPRADALLPLTDHSVDFITSSMVASQFDFEPYTFFIRNLYLHFGQDALEKNPDEVNRLAETLRNNLFLTQVDAHCREIARLLAPGGRAYFSIEALHQDHPSDHWFYAEMTSKAMEIVARHFLFDLDTLPEIIAPTRTNMVRSGTSIIYSYLLLSKHAAEKPPSHAART